MNYNNLLKFHKLLRIPVVMFPMKQFRFRADYSMIVATLPDPTVLPPLGYRTIQLGLRGNAVRKYVEEWITNITDITDYVQELREKKEQGEDIRIFLPQEHVYTVR